MLLCGREPILERKSIPKIAVVKFIFSQKEMEILEKIKEEYPNCIQRISDISDLKHEIIDSSSRYGFYILSCKKEEWEEIQKLQGENK